MTSREMLQELVACWSEGGLRINHDASCGYALCLRRSPNPEKCVGCRAGRLLHDVAVELAHGTLSKEREGE